ncbi:plasma membrane fusion protein [Senna tora]|uniref:Plasma membrane fusion protein n=1 Tax=Senna tora TaxID=362788 RepID=A0A834W8Q1_9FABA|nr:plasma membrane fusion protein [Senna tora]
MHKVKEREEYDDDDDTMRRWKEKKSKFQESNSVFALAANRTRRIDPSNDFKLYEGGWDVTNSHYYLV